MGEGKGIEHEEGCPGCKCEKKAPSKGAKCCKIKATEEETVAFRSSLCKLGDVYVNDAFGTALRAHSSMVGTQGKMPCLSGLLVAKELEAFSQVIDSDKVQRPLTAIVGGAKIADKVLVIENLIDKADKIILCGGMAYTFLKVCFGMEIGKSLFDKAGAELAPKLMEKAKAKGVEIVLPVDWACGQDFKNDQEIKMVTKEEGIPEGWEGMDCGPKSMNFSAAQFSVQRPLFGMVLQVSSSSTISRRAQRHFLMQSQSLHSPVAVALSVVEIQPPQQPSGTWRTKFTLCQQVAVLLLSCWRANSCQVSLLLMTSTEVIASTCRADFFGQASGFPRKGACKDLPNARVHLCFANPCSPSFHCLFAFVFCFLG